jgi:hypothetical protein
MHRVDAGRQGIEDRQHVGSAGSAGGVTIAHRPNGARHSRWGFGKTSAGQQVVSRRVDD